MANDKGCNNLTGLENTGGMAIDVNAFKPKTFFSGMIEKN